MVFGKLMKFLKKKKVKKNIVKRTPRKKIKKKITVTRKTRKKPAAKSLRKPAVRKEELVGQAVHYFSKIKVVVLKMKGPLQIGDKIRIKGYTTDFTQPVTSMQIDHQPVQSVKKGQEMGILVKGKVRHKDKVYKI
ncbi:MAG: hypothetical protein PHS93_04805 [Candidatus Omnitrophica bacterium]|nr:hypothetical protein [Candidatus Omnitrophota bacterium]MDD5352472.1 hypothetical protein [Candidatus Omnitrophota bacterium]MDD5550070.1 hypothetical protein [Candidatus Omnitrophota bacterium]